MKEGKDLSRKNFDYQNLSGVDFCQVNLDGSSFRHCILNNADFTNAQLQGCDFSHASLIGACFTDSCTGISEEKLVDLLFSSLGIAFLIGSSSIASGSDTGLNIDENNESNVSGFTWLASLVCTAISVLCLKSSTLSFLSSNYTILFENMLIASIFLGASFYFFKQGVNMLKNCSCTSFYKSDLTEAIFQGATIKNTVFKGATLENIDWDGATLEGNYFELQ